MRRLPGAFVIPKPTRITDRYPAVAPRIVINQLRQGIQRVIDRQDEAIDRTNDLMARFDAFEREKRERERQARRRVP